MLGRELSNAFFITNDIFMSVGIFYLTVHLSLLLAFIFHHQRLSTSFHKVTNKIVGLMDISRPWFYLLRLFI